MRHLLFISLVVLVFGCSKKEDTISETVGPTFNAKLTLTIVHNEMVNGVPTTTLVQNATVKLHETLQDAINNTHIKYTRTTNEYGEAKFETLAKPKYYMQIAHALYGFKIDSVDTPNNSFTSWEETL